MGSLHLLTLTGHQTLIAANHTLAGSLNSLVEFSPGHLANRRTLPTPPLKLSMLPPMTVLGRLSGLETYLVKWDIISNPFPSVWIIKELCIFMASNPVTEHCNKHVNIQHKGINEFIRDKKIKLFYIEGSENPRHVYEKSQSYSLYKV